MQVLCYINRNEEIRSIYFRAVIIFIKWCKNAIVIKRHNFSNLKFNFWLCLRSKKEYLVRAQDELQMLHLRRKWVTGKKGFVWCDRWESSKHLIGRVSLSRWDQEGQSERKRVMGKRKKGMFWLWRVTPRIEWVRKGNRGDVQIVDHKYIKFDFYAIQYIQSSGFIHKKRFCTNQKLNYFAKIYETRQNIEKQNFLFQRDLLIN